MGIEIANLTGTLKKLAELADGNGNKIIEEGNELTVFKNYAETAVDNDQVSKDDYKKIFGSEINDQTVTKPLSKKDKEAVERKERNLVNRLEEVVNTETENVLPALREKLGKGVNDPVYVELQNKVQTILNAINSVGYNSKDDVEDLYDKVKENLNIKRKDDFSKKVLKALIKNAEYVQSTKEFGEIKAEYDKLVKEGKDEEEAFKAVKEKFDGKGSYYHDFLRKRGSFFYKMTHFKSKLSRFESTYIMPEARNTVREAIYESDSTSSKDVKNDAEDKLKNDKNYNKYTQKALGGENNFKQWISGQDSDMKIARKNQARKNTVIDVRENGLSEEEILDKVDKKTTFLFFKKKTDLFEALVNSGLITDLGNGKYDIKQLSELIGLYVGSNYQLDRQSADFKALAEKTKTTSALALAAKLEKLTPKEAKMLVEMCGYDIEGKGFNGAKAILGGVIGGLVNGIGGGIAASTNPKYYYDSTLTNTNDVIVNINCSDSVRDEIVNGWTNKDAQLQLIEGGIQIVIHQENIIPLFWEGSKHIVKTALKSAAFGAAIGLLAGFNSDDSEKPITSTQFECKTLDEYEKILDNEVSQGVLKPQYKEALMLIAATCIDEDDNGNKFWNCEEYKAKLNKAAGDGGVLNREELIGALEKWKKEIDESTNPVDGGENPPVEDEHNYSTKDKDAVKAEYQDVPVIDGRTTSWTKIAGQYDCLIERYGLEDAIRMIKIAQAINNGDYSKENMEKLLATSKKGLSHMKGIEGVDYEAYKSALQATYLPALQKDNEGNNIPGTGVKVPVDLAECTRDASKSLKAEASSNDGTVVAPTGHAADRIKVKDGQPAKFYARFDDGPVQEFDSMKDRDDAVAAFKKQYPNAKVEKWTDEE